MAELETHSPSAAYASKNNIVLPHPRAGGRPATEVASRAKAAIEERLGGGNNPTAVDAPLAGKTLDSDPTIPQEP